MQEILDAKDEETSEDVRSRLLSWFFIAKFHNKFFSTDRQQQMAATQRSVDFYRKVVDFCKSDEKAKLMIQEEFMNSIDAADLLERQIIAYNLQNENSAEMKSS